MGTTDACLYDKWFLFVAPDMTMRRRRTVAMISVLVAAAAPLLRGAEIMIHLHHHGSSPGVKTTGTVTAQNVVDSSRPLVFGLPAKSISLPPGDWFLSAHIDGEWSEPRLVSVRDTPQTADLSTYPLARLTARVTLATGKEAHELQAYFHRVSMEDTSAPTEGSVACDVAKRIATCQLPAGQLDLAFRITGYVSRYRWNTSLTTGAPFDAGTLHFTTGSTLSGRVEIPQHRQARLDRVTVVVKPAIIPGANDQFRHRNEAARLTAHPTRRGMFAFDLPPGQFTIQASYNELISEELKVDVPAGRESILRQPLRLEPQRSVTVRVHPPVDPWSGPWKVAFASVDPTGFLLSERSLKTSADGTCRFDNVLPGPHRLTVVRAASQNWASQMVDVDRDLALDVGVDVVRLTGAIRLGAKPLAATVTLQSFEPGASVMLRSKADGTFAARLPAPLHDTWDEIEIDAEVPPVKRTLQHVHFQRRDDGSAELNVDLPSRSISGTVVDDMGRPTAPAMIDVLFPDNSLQQIVSSDGSFVVTGLESGRHRLRASSRDLESIDLQDVVLSDDKDAAADAILVVVPVGHLRGVIRALDGAPLGAVLFATPPGDHTRPIILSRADPEGRFDIRFPASTKEVAIAINAPGFAFRLARAPISMDEETFAVDQNGGTLSIDAPATHSGLRPYLVHDGAALAAAVIGYVAGVPFQATLSERVRYQIPSIEPGAYSLCWIADGPSAPSETPPPCVTGVLAPHGALTFSE
jgi:hypothetical protein